MREQLARVRADIARAMKARKHSLEGRSSRFEGRGPDWLISGEMSTSSEGTVCQYDQAKSIAVTSTWRMWHEWRAWRV